MVCLVNGPTETKSFSCRQVKSYEPGKACPERELQREDCVPDGGVRRGRQVWGAFCARSGLEKTAVILDTQMGR